MTEQTDPPFSVVVFDMARTREPDGERIVSGFATLDDATAYSIARVRASVEELRSQDSPSQELRSLWHLYGEDCSVLDTPVRASDLLDEFIAKPATPAECNWKALAPRLRRFRAMFLVSNPDNTSVWTGGFFRSTFRLDRQGLLARFRDDIDAKFAAIGMKAAEPLSITVAYHFELPDPPRPLPGDPRPLRSWKVTVGFVCHDVKFGADASGVFAWPEEPTGRALDAMQYLLIADMMAWRGDGPDYAQDADIISVKVSETDAPPDYLLD